MIVAHCRLPIRQGIAISKGRVQRKSALLFPSLESNYYSEWSWFFTSHPCFYTSSTNYILKHLHKAINKGKYVCIFQRCVSLISLASTNPYHIPTANDKTESHTLLPSRFMIYAFGRCCHIQAWKIPTHNLGQNLNVTYSGNLPFALIRLGSLLNALSFPILHLPQL